MSFDGLMGLGFFCHPYNYGHKSVVSISLNYHLHEYASFVMCCLSKKKKVL